MDALKNTVSIEDENTLSADNAEAGAISIDEIAMREEKSCFCICEYGAE